MWPDSCGCREEWRGEVTPAEARLSVQLGEDTLSLGKAARARPRPRHTPCTTPPCCWWTRWRQHRGAGRAGLQTQRDILQILQILHPLQKVTSARGWTSCWAGSRATCAPWRCCTAGPGASSSASPHGTAPWPAWTASTPGRASTTATRSTGWPTHLRINSSFAHDLQLSTEEVISFFHFYPVL